MKVMDNSAINIEYSLNKKLWSSIIPNDKVVPRIRYKVDSPLTAVTIRPKMVNEVAVISDDDHFEDYP